MEDDSVTMGNGYANDIYYSFENGEVTSVVRTNWDIGFYTSTWSAGIIINDGTGMELYLYPKADTSGWSSVDTTGLSTWSVLYNSTEDWEIGAFNRNELGHPDYGWGVYNTITHDVVGDSIYIMKWPNNVYKKFQVIKKVSTQNTYYFRYANLDGTDEVNEVIDCSSYTAKNFVYYSLTNQEVLDREPVSDSWDILFTKYNTILEDGSPYLVVGLLSNINVSSNRFDPVDESYNNWSALPMDSSRASIGYDWKAYSFTSGWEVYDSTVFFVNGLDGNVYKLLFTGFEGTSSGKIVFEKSLASPAGISVVNEDPVFLIYPNPASDIVSIQRLNASEDQTFRITDLNGKEVFEGNLFDGKSTVNISRFNSGLYFIFIGNGSETSVHKLLIK